MSRPETNSAQTLITQHLDLWTSAITSKKTTGRGSSKKIELYGIKKLRELILELAVRGKLVPQDPNDEPASELLKRVEEKKLKLVEDGIIKKPKKLPELSLTDVPCDIPSRWVWSRIEEFSLIAPRNEVADDLEVGFVPMPLVSTSYKGEHAQEVRPWKEIKKGYTHFADGDIAIAKITPCFENSKAAVFSGLSNGVGAGTTELHVARPFSKSIVPLYVLLYLKSTQFLAVGETKMTGSAGQKRVPKDFFARNPIPLPPENEQNRIVAKVDELMALCDQLENQTEQSLDAHATLADTLLDALTSAQSHTELMENWARLEQNWDILFPSSIAGLRAIDKLKQTILQLAVMGKLVPQDPTDEPASELLKRIAAEKSQLVKDKKIKKQKPLPPITDAEKPFELPDGWEWCRLESLTQLITKGSSPKWQGVSYTEDPNDVLFVTSENVGSFGLLLETEKYVEKKFNEIEAKSILQKMDVLMNIVGGSIGRTAVFDLDRIANINQAVCLIRLVHGYISMEYLLKFFNSNTCISYMFDKQVDNARANLSMTNIAKFVIPLPPLEEQKRIVAKVEELSTLCDQLKQRLQTAQQTQQHFTDAVVAGELS